MTATRARSAPVNGGYVASMDLFTKTSEISRPEMEAVQAAVYARYETDDERRLILSMLFQPLRRTAARS